MKKVRCMVGQSVKISLATNEVEVQINYNQFADINVKCGSDDACGKTKCYVWFLLFCLPKNNNVT